MRRYIIWGGIAALWLGLIGLAWFLSQRASFGMVDFRVYYDGARLLLDHQPLYQGTGGLVYLYPPLLAQMLMPIVAVTSYEVTWALWFALDTVLLIGVVAALSQYLRQPRWLWLITPFFLPVLEAYANGQVTIILLALFAGTWLAVRHERRFLAGVLLALACWLKVFPAVVVVYFLWKRDWRVVVGVLAGGIGLALVQIVISGPAIMTEMFRVLFSLTSAGQEHLVVINASVMGFSAQLFQGHEHVTPLFVSPTLTLITRLLLTFGLLGGLLYFTSPRDDARFDLEYALALLTALLLSPTLFPTSMPPALLVYFLLRRARPTRTVAWFCALACLLLSLYWPFVIGYMYNDPPLSGLVLSFGFYTLIATWGVTAYLLRQPVARRAEIPAAQPIEA